MTDKKLLIERIQRLKEERRAIILAHNYQRAEVQEIADFAGDSLELARKASANDADVIVFCGVHFMAETAALLSPQKTVLLPDPEAGCPMADMADAEGVAEMRAKHPGAVVVCYVNSTAAVKAQSDVCCTSSNAMSIAERIPSDREIVFVPDKHLGTQIMKHTGRTMHMWDGHCPVHNQIRVEHLDRARAAHPGAPVMVHPECVDEVCSSADAVLSTGGMCSYAAASDAPVILVGTEPGLLHRLRKENPDKTFVPVLEEGICPDMKLITLEKIAQSLEELSPVITVEEGIRDRARRAVEVMLGEGPILPAEV